MNDGVVEAELAPDGRAARWEQHNLERRKTLIEEAVRAIRELGPNVGMDEIATYAKTSKTVLYRHFGDKNGLYQAVVESVHDFILRKLPFQKAAKLEPHELIRELADSYLAVVERDRNLYLFVTSRPAGETPVDDPVLSITTRIGNETSDLLRAWLVREGQDPDPANIWAHGAVGFIWAVADRWIVTNLRRPRADVVAYVDQFFAPAFAAQQRS